MYWQKHLRASISHPLTPLTGPCTTGYLSSHIDIHGSIEEKPIQVHGAETALFQVAKASWLPCPSSSVRIALSQSPSTTHSSTLPVSRISQKLLVCCKEPFFFPLDLLKWTHVAMPRTAANYSQDGNFTNFFMAPQLFLFSLKYIYWWSFFFSASLPSVSVCHVCQTLLPSSLLCDEETRAVFHQLWAWCTYRQYKVYPTLPATQCFQWLQ